MTYISVHQNTHDCLDTKPVSQTLNILTQFLNGLIRRFRLMQNRKHLVTLREMSVQQLLDMGLNHGDIFEASRLGRNIDVTTHLAGVARRRRELTLKSMSRK